MVCIPKQQMQIATNPGDPWANSEEGSLKGPFVWNSGIHFQGYFLINIYCNSAMLFSL